MPYFDDPVDPESCDVYDERADVQSFNVSEKFDACELFEVDDVGRCCAKSTFRLIG